MRSLVTTGTANKIGMIKENEQKTQFEEFKQQFSQSSPKVQAMFIERFFSSKMPGFSEKLQSFAIQECAKTKDGIKEIEKIFVKGNEDVQEAIAKNASVEMKASSAPIVRYCYEQGARWME